MRTNHEIENQSRKWGDHEIEKPTNRKWETDHTIESQSQMRTNYEIESIMKVKLLNMEVQILGWVTTYQNWKWKANK